MPKTKATAKTKTLPYDVAEQLRTPEEMAAYLDAWLSEAPEDAAGIARALGHRPRQRHVTGRPRCGTQPRKPLQSAQRKRQPEPGHCP